MRAQPLSDTFSIRCAAGTNITVGIPNQICSFWPWQTEIGWYAAGEGVPIEPDSRREDAINHALNRSIALSFVFRLEPWRQGRCCQQRHAQQPAWRCGRREQGWARCRALMPTTVSPRTAWVKPGYCNRWALSSMPQLMHMLVFWASGYLDVYSADVDCPSSLCFAHIDTLSHNRPLCLVPGCWLLFPFDWRLRARWAKNGNIMLCCAPQPADPQPIIYTEPGRPNCSWASAPPPSIELLGLGRQCSMTPEWSWVGHFQSHDVSGLQVQLVCAIMVEIGEHGAYAERGNPWSGRLCDSAAMAGKSPGDATCDERALINQVSLYCYGDVWTLLCASPSRGVVAMCGWGLQHPGAHACVSPMTLCWFQAMPFSPCQMCAHQSRSRSGTEGDNAALNELWAGRAQVKLTWRARLGYKCDYIHRPLAVQEGVGDHCRRHSGSRLPLTAMCCDHDKQLPQLQVKTGTELLQATAALESVSMTSNHAGCGHIASTPSFARDGAVLHQQRWSTR